MLISLLVFYTGDTARNKKGTGLGLSIAQSLMKKMNGELFATLKNHQFIMTCQLKKERSPLLFSHKKAPKIIRGFFGLLFRHSLSVSGMDLLFCVIHSYAGSFP